MTPPFFLLPTSRARELCKEATGPDRGRPTCQEAAALLMSVSAPRDGIPRVKGGISVMAKKAAKGGKKKGGKKR